MAQSISTLASPLRTRSRARRFFRASFEFGITRVRRPWRPKRPVQAVGSPRALSWIVPSAFNSCGATTAHSGCASSCGRENRERAVQNTAVGIQQP